MSERNNQAAILRAEMAATWQWRIDTDPELAASLGLLSVRRSTHALDPRSLESFAKRHQWLQAALTRVREKVQRMDLHEADQLSYDLYVQQLTDYVTFTPKYKAYLCCVNRLEGPQTDLALYAKYLPVASKEQRQFYSAFLQAIPKQLLETTDLLKHGLQEKRTPPQVSLEGVVVQLRGMIEGKLEAFRAPIRTAFPSSEKEAEEACVAQIDGPVTAAFIAFTDFLEKEYIPSLRTEISAEQGYPDGVAYYKDCLAFHTTTAMSPQEVHQLGLDEVKRVRENMEAIAASDGYKDRLEDYLEHLRTSDKYTPQSAQQLVAHFRNVAGKIAPAMLKLFHLSTLPRMPFEIIETPASHASTAPAAYYLAGSTNANDPRPGTFYVNTSELQTRRTYECEALALHEAIPGHHTQSAVQGENPELPDFRRFLEDRRYFEAPCRFPFYTGYIEGWGLHSETLGKELGLYEQPSDQMGQLSMEALRSCRLVVDTGMHALGWSKEQALEFMLANTAMGKHDATQEVARYITWPGQATAYKVGERFLHKLRSKAELALKDAFDPRDFYDVVLQCGAVPLDILERLVDQYIDKIKNGIPRQGGGSSTTTTTISTGMTPDSSFLEAMTFANWCKCCVVPGSCSPLQ